MRRVRMSYQLLEGGMPSYLLLTDGVHKMQLMDATFGLPSISKMTDSLLPGARNGISPISTRYKIWPLAVLSSLRLLSGYPCLS